MLRLPRPAASVIATLAAAVLLPAPAWATNDGQLCSGVGLLLCAPLALVQVLTPRPTENPVFKAIRDGDLDRVKQLTKHGSGSATPEYILRAAISAYMDPTGTGRDAEHLAVLQHALTLVDVSGDKGTTFLQTVVMNNHDLGKQGDYNAPQRLTIARLLLEHGATARGVMLNECHGCETDDDFVPLLIQHGADPNHALPGSPALLDHLIAQDHQSAAERLVNLGADPNGSGWGQRSMLSRISDGCNLKRMRPYLAPERFEIESQACIARTIERTRFAVRQLGADPNGRASPATECVTPYESALDAGNVALAQALVSLGADADLGRRCRAALRAAGPGPALQ